MPTLLDDDLVTDSLKSLPGWEGDTTRLVRDVHLSPELDAELRRQVEVDSGAMGHAAQVETIEGGTRFVLRTEESGGVTELDISLASHISDLAHRLSGDERGVEAVRSGEAKVVIRPGESAADDGGELTDEDAGGAPRQAGVPSVTGGGAPQTPLPSSEPHSPEPGVSTEQTRP